MKEITLATARGAIKALRSGNVGQPRLLALHGWLDNAASFVPLFPYLTDFDVVAVDLPGHGHSAHRQPGYDYNFVDWIHDVLDILDALAWQQAMLLGHSMGGAIATVVAASAPERITKLALIEALGPIPGNPEEAGARLRHAVAARRGLSLAKTPRIIPDLETAVNARLMVSNMTREAAGLIVQRNLRAVEGGFIWRSDPRLTLPTPVRADEASIRSWIRAIEAPSLVIAAEPAPPYFTRELLMGRQAELRKGQVETMVGGHHLHMEQPKPVADVLRNFLMCG